MDIFCCPGVGQNQYCTGKTPVIHAVQLNQNENPCLTCLMGWENVTVQNGITQQNRDALKAHLDFKGHTTGDN